MALVVDNSVIVGWFVPDQSSDYTRRIARKARREELVVPALWETEFANVMTVLARRRLLLRHQVATILGQADRLKLKVDREPVSPRSLFALTERHAISAYDAAYLELAQRLGLPLATRDASLATAARAAGVALT
jgi:predicted nucleic acid-binding protein